MKPLSDSKPDDLSPFQRMRALARGVVAVSKAELDKKEAEYQRERAHKRRRTRRA